MISEICISEGLLESAKEVFETMAFIDVCEDCDFEQTLGGLTLLSSITFTGQIEGCLAICYDLACARYVAANMVGANKETDIDEEDSFDASGELANMIMGSLKHRLMDEFGSCQVSIPSIVSGRQLINSLGEGATRLVIKILIDTQYPAELTFLYRKKQA